MSINSDQKVILQNFVASVLVKTKTLDLCVLGKDRQQNANFHPQPCFFSCLHQVMFHCGWKEVCTEMDLESSSSEIQSTITGLMGWPFCTDSKYLKERLNTEADTSTAMLIEKICKRIGSSLVNSGRCPSQIPAKTYSNGIVTFYTLLQQKTWNLSELDFFANRLGLFLVSFFLCWMQFRFAFPPILLVITGSCPTLPCRNPLTTASLTFFLLGRSSMQRLKHNTFGK